MNLIKRNFQLTPSVFDQLIYNQLTHYNLPEVKQPAVNISEDDIRFVIEFAVPGKTKADFIIEAKDDVLSISLETDQSDSDITSLYYKREFDYTSFQRNFTIPDNVATEKIKALYNKGVLKLTLPKKKESLPKPKKLITVN
tara:strand:- start:7876 stop:8298 length:423 start_codon:yes stop_codon:yes gene_type:complete